MGEEEPSMLNVSQTVHFLSNVWRHQERSCQEPSESVDYCKAECYVLYRPRIVLNIDETSVIKAMLVVADLSLGH